MPGVEGGVRSEVRGKVLVGRKLIKADKKTRKPIPYNIWGINNLELKKSFTDVTKTF